MIFDETAIVGAFFINLERRSDPRGFFARMFCATEFAERGLKSSFVQANDSLSATKGTLRGMHYQLAPSAEAKLVRCARGAFYDVILDLRPDSPTFGASVGVELTHENRTMVYVPEGVAHGFLTLEDDTEAIYFVSAAYAADRERGIRWNDPAFGIRWPFEPTVVSEKDTSHPDFDRAWHLG